MANFTYDGYNRLETSTTASEATTYSYNAVGERIKKVNQNGRYMGEIGLAHLSGICV